MFSALPQIADIARSEFHNSANQLYCRSCVLGIMRSGDHAFWGSCVLGIMRSGDHAFWGSCVLGIMRSGDHAFWGSCVLDPSNSMLGWGLTTPQDYPE